ncbi:MAG: prolipoprotein diacylglyceryl transferase [Pseudomonadota bacterium]
MILLLPNAIPFPDISPDVFVFEIAGREFALKWYALAYIAGFLIAMWFINYLRRQADLWADNDPGFSSKDVEDLLTWMIIGVILGGRFGFAFFYGMDTWRQDFWWVFRIWEGGMSFHGGFIGVIVAGAWFCARRGIDPWKIGDAIAISATFGLGLGRVANFINGELWGRPTEMPWGVIFPSPAAQDCFPLLVTECARHPSQLYEAVLEGPVLWVFLTYLIFRRFALKKPGQVIAWFFIGYGVARTFVEGYRQGDLRDVTFTNPAGHYLRFGDQLDSIGLTRGQLLSLPMIVIGIVLLIYIHRLVRPSEV